MIKQLWGIDKTKNSSLKFMVKYYTRACNFYFGSNSLEKSTRNYQSLCINKLISFDTIEILSRKNIRRINI